MGGGRNEALPFLNAASCLDFPSLDVRVQASTRYCYEEGGMRRLLVRFGVVQWC